MTETSRRSVSVDESSCRGSLSSICATGATPPTQPPHSCEDTSALGQSEQVAAVERLDDVACANRSDTVGSDGFHAGLPEARSVGSLGVRLDGARGYESVRVHRLQGTLPGETCWLRIERSA